jgi:aspartate/glutamate racemase
MRTIGLIGEMSWESSAAYYRLLNQGVRDALGPTALARCILWSFDFSEIEARRLFLGGRSKIMLLLRPEESAVPLCDTIALHANAAVALALS